MSSHIRVAKHRIEKALANNQFLTARNLEILAENNINIKPYIKRYKKNLDEFANNLGRGKQDEANN